MVNIFTQISLQTKRTWSKVQNLFSPAAGRASRLRHTATSTIHAVAHTLRQGAQSLLQPLMSPIQNMPKLVRSLALAIVLLVPVALAVSAGPAWYHTHLAKQEGQNTLPAVEVPLAEVPTPLPEVVPIPELKPAPKPVMKKPVLTKPKVVAKPCINDSKLKPNQRCVPKLEKYMPNSFKRENGKFVCSKKNDHGTMSKKYNKTHVDMQCCLDPDEIPNPWCTYK